MTKSKKVAFFALHLVLWGGVLALYVAIIMWLWNWLVPAITGWSCISYWQAFGLFVLAHLLSGTLFHWGGRGGHRGFHHHAGGFAGSRGRMGKMSREERRSSFMKHMAMMHGEDVAGMGDENGSIKQEEDAKQ